MTVSIVAAGSVLAVLFTLVFARELQRRRALESLLSNILTYWRSHDAEERAAVPDAAVVAAGSWLLLWWAPMQLLLLLLLP